MRLIVRVIFIALLITSILFSSELNRLEKEIKKLYRDVSPSIVSIHFGSKKDSDFVGTGVVIDGKGHIVTIKRFLSDYNIWVETDKGEKLDAELLGVDSETGVAVIKVKKSLKPVKFCNPKDLAPGDLLFIVGNSFGLKNGISISVFSGRRDDDDFLQLGNSVLPGNSGAGVFNSNGKLAGIVSFTLGTSIFYGAPEIKSLLKKEFRIRVSPKLEVSRGMDGPGVVLPQNRMMELANEIIKYGKIERGWLGVFIKEESGEIIVSDLADDGPAEKYGIKKGDIIIKYNKKDVQDIQSFIKTVKETKPGRKVQITVKRGKKKVNIDVIIDKRPEENKLYKFKEIIPPLRFFYEKDELKQLKEEIEKLKKELEKQKKN